MRAHGMQATQTSQQAPCCSAGGSKSRPHAAFLRWCDDMTRQMSHPGQELGRSISSAPAGSLRLPAFTGIVTPPHSMGCIVQKLRHPRDLALLLLMAEFSAQCHHCREGAALIL